MNFTEILLLAVLLCALAFGVTTLMAYIPQTAANYTQYEGNMSLLPKVGAVQFYPNMRFNDTRITYSIESKCSDKNIADINEALRIISNATILRFEEVDHGGQITYLCSLPAPTSETRGHFVAGEGGPTKIINTTSFSLILAGQVALYRPEKCMVPNIAIHETLHALGFDHVNDETDIMYPITDCNKQIKSIMPLAINKLYSYQSLPDLSVDYVTANQTGKYLNFHITIANHGLRDSGGASLTIFADSEKVKSFDMGKVNIGMKKFLDVQNLLLGSKASKISFVLTAEDGQGDLFPTDDFAEINLIYQ